MIVNKKDPAETRPPVHLADIESGQEAVLDHLQLPEDISRRLMELGFLPGHTIGVGKAAPGGDPRVYRVDGSEIALRHETASRLVVRRREAPPERECS
jgi:ferrous iron transport protein A